METKTEKKRETERGMEREQSRNEWEIENGIIRN